MSEARTITILLHYLKVAWRSIVRRKLFSAIAIGGLSIGIASVGLIVLYVQNEFSYDRFHPYADRIYRLTLDSKGPNGVNEFDGTSYPMGPGLKSEFPEIQEVARFKKEPTHLIRYGDKSFYEEHIVYTDSSIFKVFGFTLERGTSSALDDAGAVVLSHDAAQKYFGGEDPIGKLLQIDDSREIRVSAVLAPLRGNSHFQFDFLLPFSAYPVPSGYRLEDYRWLTFNNYLLLRKGTKPEALTAKFPIFLRKVFTPRIASRLVLNLEPLPDVHFDVSRGSDLGPTTNALYPRILLGLALALLLVACSNYMNMAAAQSVGRVREGGLRRILGGARLQLISQFLVESLVAVLAAFLIALLLIEVLTKPLADLLGVSLATGAGSYVLWGVLMGLITLAATIAGGIYPAVVITRVPPALTVRSGLSDTHDGGVLQKIMIVSQFAVSVGLLIATIIVFEQIRYMRSKDLGFDREQVLVVPLQSDDLRARYDRLRNELLRDAHVLSVGAARNGLAGGYGSYPVRRPGSEEPTQISIYPVRYGFFSTLHMHFAQGRGFSEAIASDAQEGIVLNESAVAKLGLTDPMGSRLIVGGSGAREHAGGPFEGRVIGVVKDFHFQSLTEKIHPLLIYFGSGANYYLFVRLTPGDARDAVRSIEADWRRIAPDYPFEYSFLNERIGRMYKADSRFAYLVSGLSTLAILVACVGLFGLVAIATQRRTREIGIRKVLGASSPQLLLLLLRDFLLLVGAAFLVAVPLAYVAINHWLQHYAYRIEMGWWMFAVAGSIVLLLALLTTMGYVLKAASANPVETLRCE